MKQQNLALWGYLQMTDKYVYPGTRFLINKLDIRSTYKRDIQKFIKNKLGDYQISNSQDIDALLSNQGLDNLFFY